MLPCEDKTILSLSTCPGIISQIIGYMSDDILIQCDTDAYVVLQRAIDCVWAQETRRLLKSTLQRVQVAVALQSPHFLFLNAAVCRNPLFVRSIKNYSVLADQFAVAHEHDCFDTLSFLLRTIWKNPILPSELDMKVESPWYPLRREKVILRAAKVLGRQTAARVRVDDHFFQAVYTIVEDVECVEDDMDGIPVHYDVALVRENLEDSQFSMADVFAVKMKEDGSVCHQLHFHFDAEGDLGIRICED